MEAEVTGSQRKIFGAGVRPAKAVYGDSGIAVRSGTTLPFVVKRAWSAPAGHYPEQWFLVHPDTKEVLYESDASSVLIWGLQSITELSTRVNEPIPLQPGRYLVVFALGGIKGGEIEVDATEAPAEAA